MRVAPRTCYAVHIDIAGQGKDVVQQHDHKRQMGNLHQSCAFRINTDNRTIENHGKDDQRKADGISQTDNTVT